MNVLIDTNVLLSAALRDKLPERVVLHVATRDDARWLVTPEILAEYSGVLRRPKFGLDEQALQRWDELLAMRTVNIASPPRRPTSRAIPRTLPFSPRPWRLKPISSSPATKTCSTRRTAGHTHPHRGRVQQRVRDHLMDYAAAIANSVKNAPPKSGQSARPD